MSVAPPDPIEAALDAWFGHDLMADGTPASSVEIAKMQRAIAAYLAALPAPDAAGLRAEGFAECAEKMRIACLRVASDALTERRNAPGIAEQMRAAGRETAAVDCIVALAALKPGTGK